jgi:hypothetical protein
MSNPRIRFSTRPSIQAFMNDANASLRLYGI